jgi:hypothetical protein
MTINVFDIQFFELVTLLKNPLTENSSEQLRKVLLKLKNPTYYEKYISKHPANSFGYYKNLTINPVLIAISNMLSILKSEHSIEKKLIELQKEYSWAFNNYSWYCSLSNQSNIKSQ